jgi:delta 1-pyrroline-5-carboxylate dehydrogenase
MVRTPSTSPAHSTLLLWRQRLSPTTSVTRLLALERRVPSALVFSSTASLLTLWMAKLLSKEDSMSSWQTSQADRHLSLRLINPTTEKSLGHITVASEKDIDIAVEAAQKAFDTTWGLHASGQERGKLLIRLAELIEENIDELAALESLDNGEPIF